MKRPVRKEFVLKHPDTSPYMDYVEYANALERYADWLETIVLRKDNQMKEVRDLINGRIQISLKVKILR